MTELEKSELAEAIAEKVTIKVTENIQELLKVEPKSGEKEETEKYKEMVKQSLN